MVQYKRPQGAIGGPANTTYGENTSVVGMTTIASVWVIGLAAIIAIVLGFLGKFTAIVSTIPNPVLGGVSLLLYGFIAVNGLKVLIENQIHFGVNKNIVVASTMLVLGLGGAAVSIVHGDLSLTISGMSLAAVIGILLNLLLRDPEAETKAEVKVEKASTLEKDVEELKADVKMLKAEIEKLKGNKQAPKEEAKEEPKEENNGTNNNNNNQKKKKKHK